MRLGQLKGVMAGALAVSLLVLNGTALANSGGGEKVNEGINYIPIKPALIVNYGGAGKIRYIKAEISLRTEDAESATHVSHHMPLIKDTLIMYLSTMTLEQLSSGEGKEQMREEALRKVNEAMEAAEHPDGAHGDEKKHGKDDHAKADHGKGEHGKDEHAKDEHGKDEHGADEHAKDDHGKKSKKAKEEPEPLGPVSDLLFDNLVVQK